MPYCWAPGCKTGYKGLDNTGRHFFQVPSDSERVKQWQKHIPRVGQLSSKHRICDLHFEQHCIVKTYPPINIDGKTVQLERGKWELTADAVPTIFPCVPKYLSTRVPKPRSLPTKHHLAAKSTCSGNADEVTHSDCSIATETTAMIGETAEAETSVSEPFQPSRFCCSSRCKADKYNLKRRVARCHRKIRQLQKNVVKLSAKNRNLQKQLSAYQSLPPKLKTALQQAQRNMQQTGSKTGNRYSVEWILDCLLIRCKSTSTYKMLRENGYLPLPSVATLNRTIKAMRPEFGFDKALAAGLTEKLSSFTDRARRGILMFDEIQISKNIDFRVDTGKMVGFVDFGHLTQEEHTYQEGDHALVFLFQPHMGGWVQTIGSFCSAGTTPTAVLAKLILKAIILLENCGAKVDGLVSDGASTNRAALASFGFSGCKQNPVNSMANPCDDQRTIYFFCDMPHLLKTIRNNLLTKKEFLVCSIVFPENNLI